MLYLMQIPGYMRPISSSIITHSLKSGGIIVPNSIDVGDATTSTWDSYSYHVVQ